MNRIRPRPQPHLLLLAVALLLPVIGRAQPNPPPPVDPVLQRILALGKRNCAMEHLDYVTNHIGPRLTGSRRAVESVEWAVETFKSWGLEATMDLAGTVPVRFERGPWQGKMVEPEEMAFEFGTPSWSAGTRGKERGPAILAPATADGVEAIRDQVQGAWVLLPPPPPPGAAVDRGEQQRQQQRDAMLRQRLIEAGARGFISRATNPIRLLGRWPNSWEERPRHPDIRLVDRYYDLVKARLERGERVVLEFDIRNYLTPGPAPFYNALGWFKGTELPDELVIFGGHFDSYCSATGTIDNAVGAITALEAAHLLARAGFRPRRTILFALWGGEEQGLLGSRSWIERNRDRLAKISAYFNHDTGTNAIVGVSGTEAMAADLRQALGPINLLDPSRPFEVRTVPTLGSGRGGSDHAAFLRAGVPGLNWILRGPAEYGITWHTNWDTFERALSDHVEHSAAAIAVAAYGMDRLERLLPRDGIAPPRPAAAGAGATYASAPPRRPTPARSGARAPVDGTIKVGAPR